jgi:dihydrofolate reductase
MRKVIFGGANSLDNFIAREDGSYDWILFGKEAMELMKDMWPRFDAMVMGRKTYDVSAKQMSKEDLDKVKDLHTGMTTYVFSRTIPAGPTANGYIVVNDDPGEFVRELKKQNGKEIMVMGGGEIGTALLEAGVVDEIGFNIHPVLLGSGVPLFHNMKRQIDLELIEARPFKNGCVYVLYEVKN